MADMDLHVQLLALHVEPLTLRKQEVRRQFFAIALRTIANRAKFFQTGINRLYAPLQFRARLTQPAFDARREKLWQ